MADASNLEDLQDFWECPSCRYFELARIVPGVCPQCDTPGDELEALPAACGFLGRRTPHTGYENLAPRSMKCPGSRQQVHRAGIAGPRYRRIRDPDGQVITLGSGLNGKGYALCLACGRAEIEVEEGRAPRSAPIKMHWPLAQPRNMKLAQGYCPGGYTEPQRIQRNVRLSHSSRTDVFELQLPDGTRRNQGLALAAALREALAERLGAEAREIGVAVGLSTDRAARNEYPLFSMTVHPEARDSLCDCRSRNGSMLA